MHQRPLRACYCLPLISMVHDNTTCSPGYICPRVCGAIASVRRREGSGHIDLNLHAVIGNANVSGLAQSDTAVATPDPTLRISEADCGVRARKEAAGG